MCREKLIKITTAAVLAALPSAAPAVVFYDTADATKNTAPPTGALANSGWQYEFSWLGGFLGTPIAPNYFLSAKHLSPSDNGAVGAQLFYQGTAYTVTAVAGTFGADLRLYQVDKKFISYAPLYDAGSDGSEVGKSLVIIGRGGPRGTEIHTANNPSNPLLGWNWATDAASDSIERWGQNKVFSLADAVTSGDNQLIEATFNAPGKGDYTGTNEAALVKGDSGGGVFMQGANGEWKLDGINYGVPTYSFTSGGASFAGALFDTRGLYDTDDNHLITGSDNVPSSWFASRIAANTTALNSIINLPSTWNANASGTWGTSGNWAQGLPANAPGAEADFRTVINADRTVTLSAGQTLGTITFDDAAARYTLTGSTIIFDTGSGNAQINVASGNHTITSAMTLNKDLDLFVINGASTLTLSGAMTATGHTISQIGPGSVEYKYVRADTLDVQQGRARILSNGSNTSKVSTLNLPTGTSLDLTNNDLIIASGTESSWEAKVKTGYNGGAWNGTGISSSTAATTNHLTGLGIDIASDALSFTSGTRSWSGQTVTPSSILVKYTYVGDMNLDGKIDGDDYFRIDQGFGNHSAGYAMGDLNFDGKINSDDYFLIDSNYSKQSSIVLGSPIDLAAQGVSVVPEPACLSILAGVVFIAARGSRRRGQRAARLESPRR